MAKKKGLGKGLDSLLKGYKNSNKMLDSSNIDLNKHNQVINIPLNLISFNPLQPRKKFKQKTLNDLADSIKISGVIQPILVRKLENNKYELIAGERRVRASKLANKQDIIAVIKNDITEKELITLAIIENIQREDLNHLELAYSIDSLSREYELTHAKIAELLGKSRSTITNILRILQLPAEVKDMMLENKIDISCAKVLLSLNEPQMQNYYANKFVKFGLTINELEKLIDSDNNKFNNKKQDKQNNDDKSLQFFAKNLANFLNCKISINQAKNSPKGKLLISYEDTKHLEEILAKIGIKK